MNTIEQAIEIIKDEVDEECEVWATLKGHSTANLYIKTADFTWCVGVIGFNFKTVYYAVESLLTQYKKDYKCMSVTIK